MKPRLEAVEVVKLDKTFTQPEVQAFIEHWNESNPGKYNDKSFMPLFSPFIDKCHLEKSEDSLKNDVLTIVMVVTPHNWPTKQEVAQITFFVKSLQKGYHKLEVKMTFEVEWEE